MVATAFEKRDSYELLQRLEPRKCHKLCFFNTSNRLMPLKIILASNFTKKYEPLFSNTNLFPSATDRCKWQKSTRLRIQFLYRNHNVKKRPACGSSFFAV